MEKTIEKVDVLNIPACEMIPETYWIICSLIYKLPSDPNIISESNQIQINIYTPTPEQLRQIYFEMCCLILMGENLDKYEGDLSTKYRHTVGMATTIHWKATKNNNSN